MIAPRKLDDLEQQLTLRALLEAKVAPPHLCERAVRESVLVPLVPRPFAPHWPRPLVAHIALHQRASGITLGRYIYIAHRIFDEDGQLPLSLIVHEVAHVAQYRRDGVVGFLWRYVRDYAAGLWRGLSDRDAYLAIPHEVEARATEQTLQAHMSEPELKKFRRLYF